MACVYDTAGIWACMQLYMDRMRLRSLADAPTMVMLVAAMYARFTLATSVEYGLHDYL